MVEDIITNKTDELRAIQQTSLELCFQKWKGDGSGALLLREIILMRINVTKL
jgi:hypothetical protein